MARLPVRSAARPHSVPPRAKAAKPVETDPKLQELKDQAEDLGTARKALDDAVSMTRGLWISFISLSAYLMVAVGSVTHVDLFLENPLELPLVGVRVPLVVFFWLAPILYLIVHTYLLLNLHLMSDNVRSWLLRLEAVLTKEASIQERDRIAEEIRLGLPNFFAVQMLASPKSKDGGYMGLALWCSVIVTVVVGPALLLFLFQAQFLPYHSLGVTWTHRLVLFLDMITALYFWVKINAGPVNSGAAGFSFSGVASAGAAGVGFLMAVSLFLATFPTEYQHGSRAAKAVNNVLFKTRDVCIANIAGSNAQEGGGAEKTCVKVDLQTVLFEGEIDEINRSQRSIFSNRLILMNRNLISTSQNSNAGSGVTISVRGRNLANAVLARADLRRVDFTGSNLRNADVSGANLEGADFSLAYMDGTIAVGADLKEAIFEKTFVSDVNFERADFSGATIGSSYFSQVDLSGCKLVGAAIASSLFTKTNMDRCKFDWLTIDNSIVAEGSMRFATSDRALFSRTVISGTDLTSAELIGSTFDNMKFDRIKYNSSLFWNLSVFGIKSEDQFENEIINSADANYFSKYGPLKLIFLNESEKIKLSIIEYEKRQLSWFSIHRFSVLDSILYNSLLGDVGYNDESYFRVIWQRRLIRMTESLCGVSYNAKAVSSVVLEGDDSGGRVGRISSTGPFRTALATFMLDPKKCPGAVGISVEAQKRLYNWSKQARACDLQLQASYFDPLLPLNKSAWSSNPACSRAILTQILG
jgi:uncharacterized protein YjbI with pentapeptide repeats